jgi:hypothetical protein
MRGALLAALCLWFSSESSAGQRALQGRALPRVSIAGGAGTVRSTAKINELTPGFEGELTDLAFFGAALAPLGDLDGDGLGELAAGEPGIDTDQPPVTHGAVRVLFFAADGSVRAHQRIGQGQGGFLGTLDLHDDFGYAVASLGDLDLDGVGDLAVSAGRDDDGGANFQADRGAVWILFLRSDGTVKSHAKISDTAGGFTGQLDNLDYFGGSLAALGDLDGDGVTELAVGAGGDDDGGILAQNQRGAVWVLFLRRDGTVKAHAKISDSAGGFSGVLHDEDFFGSALSALDDINGDGVRDLAVGAPADDDGGPFEFRGAVWLLFLGPDGTVRGERKLSATQGGFQGPLAPGDQFGSSLAALGDLDGNGVGDLAVGAPGEGAVVGAVWVLRLGLGGTIVGEGRIAESEGGFTGQLDDFDTFGGSLAALGDRDGDGIRELGVGAFRDTDTGLYRGAVWLLSLDGVACLDFETEDDLLTPLVPGQAVISPDELGRVLSVASTGANLGPAIFDSTPGGPNDPSQDPDLLVGSGKVLIFQNSLVPTQTIPGIFDRPNDDQDGGTFTFTFGRPVEARSVALVDIDQGATQVASVRLTDASGGIREYSVPPGWTGDRVTDGTAGIRALDLRTLAPQAGYRSTATAAESAGFDARAVLSLTVHLGSSGAIDDLCFDPHP